MARAPRHRASTSRSAPTPGAVALLVDFENVFHGLKAMGVPDVAPDSVLQGLRAAAAGLGPLAVARIYTSNAARYPGLVDAASALGFELVSAPMPRRGVSNTDIVMAMHGT